MSLSEVAVVVFAAFAGYWVVSKLFFRSANPKPPPPVQKAIAVIPKTPWYEVLQVPPAASANAIREAYAQLIVQYDPDKVEALAQDLQALAARKTEQITEAYMEGLRARQGAP